MVRTLFAFALVSLASFKGAAQSPNEAFSFKGNPLGMALEDFKAKNPGKTWVNTGDPNRRMNKKLTQLVDTPLCTDHVRGFEGDNLPLSGAEVLCNASPAGTNAEGKILLGQQAAQVLYLFNSGKLYMIQVSILPRNFNLVTMALKQKYGEPVEGVPAGYQNGYGASWTGKELTWSRGSGRILASEGSGDGPAQDRSDPYNPSMIMFLDSSLAPKKDHKLQVDF